MTETVGSFLRQKRKDRGLQQADLVEKKLIRTTVLRTENDKTIPRNETIQIFVTALQLTEAEQEKLDKLVREARKKRRGPSKSGDLQVNEELLFIDVDPLDPHEDYSEDELQTRSHGEVVVYLSEKEGKTVYEIAKKAQITPGNLNRIARNETIYLKERTLKKLRDAFSLPDNTKLFRPKPIPKRTRRIEENAELKKKAFAEKSPGEKMQTWREGSNLNRRSAAEKLEIKYNKLRALENGHLPQKELREKIARLYGITVEELEAAYGIEKPSTDEFEKMTIAEFIEYHMNDNGWSQIELAKKIGKNRAIFLQIKKGQIPSKETFVALSEAFGWMPNDTNALMLQRKRIAARTKRKT